MLAAIPLLFALLLSLWAPGSSGQEPKGLSRDPGFDFEEARVGEAAALVKKGQPELPFPPEAPVAQALVSKRVSADDSPNDPAADHIFVAITVVCSAGAVVGLVGAAALWYRLHRRYKSTEEAEYGPQYGVTGPAAKGSPAGDAKLANSAHLYHYQHTKQQIIAMEHGEDGKGHESDDSEGEGEEADYSVYECPGLAPTGDIEVSNPLFESGSPVPSPPASAKPPHAQ